VPLSREKMTSVVTAHQLSSVWAPGRAFEYLLLGGLVPEAVWFVGRLGDWKSQIVLSGVVHYYREKTTSSTTRPVSHCLVFSPLLLSSYLRQGSNIFIRVVRLFVC